jgi:hypothetical protein
MPSFGTAVAISMGEPTEELNSRILRIREIHTVR